jgi:hypothetical protein
LQLCLSSSPQSTVCTKSHSMLVVVGMEQLPLAAAVVEVVEVAAVVAGVAAAKTVVDAVVTTLVHPSTWTVLV